MTRLFVPTMGPSDWRRLLGNPRTQWRAEKSAFECAVAWEAVRRSSRGLPPDIEDVLDSKAEFLGSRLLFGVPEHRVELEGGGHASQTDLWALITSPIGVCSVAVEAKAGEPFDDTVRDWLARPPRINGRTTRLEQLCGILQLEPEAVHPLRYQLMHRPVAAILEAQRFRLSSALFLVHAFGDNSDSLSDFEEWASALGVRGAENQLTRVGQRGGVDLWIGWVSSHPADDDTIRRAV